jgi:hypothetical protein
MKFTLHLRDKKIDVTHNEEISKVAFLHNGISTELEVVGTCNNKKSRTINVYVVKCLKDAADTIIKSERKDYTISSEKEYLAFYNIPTIKSEGLGFTEYMHALNGAIARCPELGGNESGDGLRVFNADGTIRNIEP